MKRSCRALWRVMLLGATTLLWLSTGGRLLGALGHYKDITIDFSQRFSDGNALGTVLSHGYQVYHVTVTNSSAMTPHQVQLVLKDTSGLSGDLGEVRWAVRVDPASTISQPLLQPLCVPLGGYVVRVFIDGHEQTDHPLRANITARSWASHEELFRDSYVGLTLPVVILVSPGVATKLESILQSLGEAASAATRRVFSVGSSALVSPRSPIPGLRYEVLCLFEMTFPRRADVPVGEWESNWLAYSGYDGIMITDAEFKQAPAAVRQSLEQFTEAGGTLTLLGRGKVPRGWTERRERYDGGWVYYPGFGMCVRIPATDVSAWDKGSWELLAFAWSQSLIAWRKRTPVLLTGDTDPKGPQRLPKIENAGLGGRGVALIAVLFSVAIALDFALLARTKRRLWLLWTVPMASAMASLAVFDYVNLAQGVNGYRRGQSITFLDERNERASTIGSVAFYTPVERRDGLAFSADSELTPISYDLPGLQRDRTAYTLDWTDGQRLTSGWLNPRVPAYFDIRKSETCQKRVLLTRGADGRLSVTNFLNAAIERLWLADAKGRVLAVDSVPLGGEKLLEDTGTTVSPDPSADCLAALFVEDWFRPLTLSDTEAAKYLLPGRYVAKLDGTPFLEEGLAGAAVGPCQSVVFGILKGDGDGK